MKYKGGNPCPAVHIAVFLLQHTLLAFTTKGKSDPSVECVHESGICVFETN
jgi:hypothetical protein